MARHCGCCRDDPDGRRGTDDASRVVDARTPARGAIPASARARAAAPAASALKALARARSAAGIGAVEAVAIDIAIAIVPARTARPPRRFLQQGFEQRE